MRSRGLRSLAGLTVGLFALFTFTWLIAESTGVLSEAWVRQWVESLLDGSEGRDGTQGYGGVTLAALLLGGLLFADLVLPVPSSVLMVLSGVLLGTVTGALVSFVGAMGSALLGFWLCRRFGRPAFARLVGDQDLPWVDAAVRDYGAWVIVLSRAVPMLTEVVSCVAGLSAMRAWTFLALAAAGTLPLCLAYAWIGAVSGDATPYGWLLLLAFVIPAVGLLLVRIARRV